MYYYNVFAAAFQCAELPRHMRFSGRKIGRMSIMHITEETFDKEVLEAPVPVLIDFWADWCGPCRMLAPTIDELEQQYRGKLHVGKIDIDQQPKLALVHKVMSIPTVSIYAHGKEVKRLIGLRDKPELDAVIQEVLAAK